MGARGGASETVDLLPAFVQGRGERAVYLPGLSPSHGVPAGPLRALEAGLIGPLSRVLELHWTGRRVGVPEGWSSADFAADYATDIRRRFGRPMPVIGFSSGGFLALQLALDHPDVVRRLVVVGADAQISADTRASNLRWIEYLRAGDLPGAWRELGTDALADPARWTRLRSWATSAAALMTTGDCTDGIRTAQSELDFDLTGSLARITAPTLLVAGGRDATLSTGSVMRTARALPHGSLVVLPRTGHVGSLLDPGAIRRIRDFVRGPA